MDYYYYYYYYYYSYLESPFSLKQNLDDVEDPMQILKPILY